MVVVTGYPFCRLDAAAIWSVAEKSAVGRPRVTRALTASTIRRAQHMWMFGTSVLGGLLVRAGEACS